MADTYFKKAAGLTELHIAVASRNAAGEVEAMQRLRIAADKANQYIELKMSQEGKIKAKGD